MLSQWQALQPFAVRQLHLHLGPDAFTLLRAHRPDRHSDRLHDVRPLVMSVLQEGAVVSGLEVGRHGIGLRAAVPVKGEQQSTLAVIEVGFGVSSLIRQQQLLMEKQGITSSGISLLVGRDALQVMHSDMQNFQAGTQYWLIDGTPSGFLSNWLQQNGLGKSVTQPQMHRVASGERHYLVSVTPWYGYQQPSEQSASLVLLAWRDITDLMLAQQAQNRRLWLLWFIACLFSLALIVFLALRLQKATAHSIKNQQLQLQWSEQRLSALFTLSPLPILLNRMADGAFIESNLAMERLVGYTQQELAALSYWDLTPESYANDEQQQLESLKSKGLYGPYRKEYRHKEGHLIPIELNGVLFENPAGEQMIWTIVQDLTERNQLDKLKDEFISTVSHELRTPLTSISGSISLVLAGAAGELTNKSKKMLDIAQRNCKRLTSLVNDLLDMEKLVAGKVTFQPQCIGLAELLQEAIEQNMPYAHSNQSQLLLEDVGAIQVLADPARVQQVLTNLLSNAVKFSPGGSVVRVTTQPKQSFVRINIIDEGPGLTAREIRALFQRFSQLSDGTTKQYSGTGLGLAICREIIQQSGGRIGVDSQPGHGACFWFELPLVETCAANQRYIELNASK
ncbi:PAS domain S-box-containing protein [Alkalimonas amylolytica]|uniref:histidine kinase n=1 Tax=Alkalimonas amylolytica TaxID=152573 RepID=A0A1H3X9G9_ALKAM|nr:PAS domain S-box-containing protein [Alkalimonas amylolytica]